VVFGIKPSQSRLDAPRTHSEADLGISAFGSLERRKNAVKGVPEV
jgi:hypothetical protein